MVYVKIFKELLGVIVHLLIKDPFAQVTLNIGWEG